MYLNYASLIPSRSFGGLEMQMVNRASDAFKLDNTAVLITIESSRADKYAEELNLCREYINPKIKYIDIWTSYKLGKMLKGYSTSICLVGKTQHLSYALMAKKLFGLDMSIILYQQMQSGLKKIDFFHNWIYRNLDGAIVITERMKHELASTTIFPIDKIEVIPCGVEIEKFNPRSFNKNVSRESFGLPKDKFIFGNIGRLDFHKDQRSAILAFAKADLPDTALVFCGGSADGYEDYEKEIRGLPAKLGIENRVFFLPFTNNVPELMNCFDVFVFPSLSETLGLVIIEAMAAKLPVIAVNSGGVPEIIEHDKNGLLIEQKDVEKLAEYMALLYHDKDTRDNFSDEGMRTTKKFEYINLRDKFFNYCERMHKNRI